MISKGPIDLFWGVGKSATGLLVRFGGSVSSLWMNSCCSDVDGNVGVLFSYYLYILCKGSFSVWILKYQILLPFFTTTFMCLGLMVEETVPNVSGIVTVSASDSMIAWVWLNAFLFI